MADWRKQLIKQAEYCCNVHWALTRMHDPEQLMVWLDAFEQGLLTDSLGWLREVRLPVSLPKGVKWFQWTFAYAPRTWSSKVRKGVTGLQQTVLYDNDIVKEGVLQLLDAQRRARVRLLEAEDIAEGELAFRKGMRVSKRLWKMYSKRTVPRDPPFVEVFVVAGPRKQRRGSERTWAHRVSELPGPWDPWFVEREKVLPTRYSGSEVRVRIHTDLHTSQLQDFRVRGWPAPIVGAAHTPPGVPGSSALLTFIYPLTKPLANPWTRRES